MIRPEDVADLQPGDVVEITETDGGDEIRHIGPLRREGRALVLGGMSVAHPTGAFAGWWDTLTVVSRAPRPLYANSDRTVPAHGDIVRDCDGDAWRFDRGEWCCASLEACDEDDPNGFPIEEYRPLTLLWDGSTGEVVQ